MKMLALYFGADEVTFSRRTRRRISRQRPYRPCLLLVHRLSAVSIDKLPTGFWPIKCALKRA